jgi:hypothetical protein
MAAPLRAPGASAGILERMHRTLALLTLACAIPASAQLIEGPGAPPAHKQGPPKQIAPATSKMETLDPLEFLLGTWSAKTDNVGTAAGKVLGLYTFHKDLDGHAIQRNSTSDSCTGPASYDCNHHDILTIFADANALPSIHKAMVFALYLDNEGHAIYYAVSSPAPNTALFLSQGPPSLPTYRLTYKLDTSGPEPVMTGTFEVAPPGSQEFHIYQQWTGTKQ